KLQRDSRQSCVNGSARGINPTRSRTDVGMPGKTSREVRREVQPARVHAGLRLTQRDVLAGRHVKRNANRDQSAISNSKTVRPGRLSTEIRPPWRSMIAFTIESPSPLPFAPPAPGCSCARDASAL